MRARQKKEKLKRIFIIIVILVVLLLIILGIKWFRKPSASDVLPTPKNIDPGAGEYVPEILESNNGTNIILPGWRELHIEANTTDITRGIDFYNPDKNEGYYYLTFKLIVNGNILYESGLVEPGKHIQRITLKKPLEAGTYDATVFIQPYKYDRITEANNANVNVKLIVE